MAHPATPAALLDERTRVAAMLDGDVESTWLVGGVVRDALLGRPLLDIDLATAGDPQRIARRIAAQTGGTAFPLGDEFGCWRVTGGTADERQFDVCALRGDSLSADLAARDYALNAMAVALTGVPDIIDEHGGLLDIEHRQVRMVSEQSLDDDPLRMLRAARITHLLDWHLDAKTMAAIRTRAHRATEPAGERTFAELRLLLLHPEARRGWRLLEQLGLDAVLLPELEACRGMAQSRFHHLDVHDHTLAVVDNCEDLLAATEFWLPLPMASSDAPPLVAAPWTEEQRLIVLLAALCHDLAKPLTRDTHPDGRVSFIGHDAVGRDVVDVIAERWRWSGAHRTAVRHLVGTHLALGYVLHTDRDARQRWRLRQTLGPLVPEAVVLSVGDRFATAGPDDRRRWVRAHLELARAVWNDHWRAVRDGVPSPLLDGREIAAVAGIEPGPALGPLVTALAEAQAVDGVVTRVEAEAVIRAAVDG